MANFKKLRLKGAALKRLLSVVLVTLLGVITFATMDIVEGIKFCQVKQIFAPYSPHVFTDSFPGVSSDDCKEKDDSGKKNCVGNPDQYGNHRSPRIGVG
ncbi:hypothetical protein GQ457_06G027550 [Hibiscus cannabinus]